MRQRARAAVDPGRSHAKTIIVFPCSSLTHPAVTSRAHECKRNNDTPHSRLSTGLASVNALSQSIFEYRRREKRSTKRLPSATAVKHVKKNRDKKQKRHLRKIVFLPIFASEKRCGRVVDIEFLSEIERKHAQWTPHAMAP